jgi:hypothetical protein
MALAVPLLNGRRSQLSKLGRYTFCGILAACRYLNLSEGPPACLAMPSGTAKSISMARVTMSKNTCRVFGRMPLRSGRKACVAAYIVR